MRNTKIHRTSDAKDRLVRSGGRSKVEVRLAHKGGVRDVVDVHINLGFARRLSREVSGEDWRRTIGEGALSSGRWLRGCGSLFVVDVVAVLLGVE